MLPGQETPERTVPLRGAEMEFETSGTGRRDRVCLVGAVQQDGFSGRNRGERASGDGDVRREERDVG